MYELQILISKCEIPADVSFFFGSKNCFLNLLHRKYKNQLKSKRNFIAINNLNSRWFSKNVLEGHDKQQVELMKEEIILVDHQDQPIGYVSKKDGHLRSYIDNETSRPHRAFSVFLFNEKNELLLQRRSSHKITFPNRWTNT